MAPAPGRWRCPAGHACMPERVFVKINGQQHDLWRAVDHEGEVLESFVTKRRDTSAALKFLKKTLKRHGRADAFVTDLLRSYRAALRDIGAVDRQQTGRSLNNRAENSHQPFRRKERAMLRFRRMRSLQTFVAVHSSIHNRFNPERALTGRDIRRCTVFLRLTDAPPIIVDIRPSNPTVAVAEWRGHCAAYRSASGNQAGFALAWQHLQPRCVAGSLPDRFCWRKQRPQVWPVRPGWHERHVCAEPHY